MAAPQSTGPVGPLPRFIALYALLYAAFGVSSPFLPSFLDSRGLTPEQIGLVLATGTAVRLIVGPVAGRIADRLHALKLVLAVSTGASALVALGYLPAEGLWLLYAVSVTHAAALTPTTLLSDALALGAATPRQTRGFDYGWVRGAGSAAFIAGSMISGQAVAASGLPVILVMHAALLAAATLAATWVPELQRSSPPVRAALVSQGEPGVTALLRNARFRRLVIVAALILGSHALHDGFAVIRWRAAGMEPGTIGLLWSESVAAEVVVFFLLGRPLLKRLGPARAAALAGAAGVLRWIVMASTVSIPLMALVQPLHGLTFALLHLAAMRLIAEIVPAALAATAQALYGTVGIGAASALLTLISGTLYGRLGPDAFWIMAGLCAIAIPLTVGLRPPPPQEVAP